MTTMELLYGAAQAKKQLLWLDTEKKNRTLHRMADCLLEDCDAIIAANGEDMEAARGQIAPVMLDRLLLNRQRIEKMADGIREVAALPDPVGRVLSRVERPNGLLIEKTTAPFGVIAMIYESRPEVTSDAAALIFKSGNVAVLRGGKEAFRSSSLIVAALHRALRQEGLPETLVNMVEDTSRDSALELMTAVGLVDILIPRGGLGLIRACVENAKVPCIETGTGVCHVYVDAAADLDMALRIVDNAKTSRPSVCNAAEVCLVHRSVAAEFLPRLKKALVDDRAAAGKETVELRLCPEAAKIIEGRPAAELDFDTEFLNYILAVRVVEDADAAIDHINAHSTKHSDAIISGDAGAIAAFTTQVDSSSVYVNVSTRFTDGGVFGLGCEIGISTQKLHARGPMGLEELTTYKYIVRGDGQIR